MSIPLEMDSSSVYTLAASVCDSAGEIQFCVQDWQSDTASCA